MDVELVDPAGERIELGFQPVGNLGGTEVHDRARVEQLALGAVQVARAHDDLRDPCVGGWCQLAQLDTAPRVAQPLEQSSGDEMRGPRTHATCPVPGVVGDGDDLDVSAALAHSARTVVGGLRELRSSMSAIRQDDESERSAVTMVWPQAGPHSQRV